MTVITNIKKRLRRLWPRRIVVTCDLYRIAMFLTEWDVKLALRNNTYKLQFNGDRTPEEQIAMMQAWRDLTGSNVTECINKLKLCTKAPERRS